MADTNETVTISIQAEGLDRIRQATTGVRREVETMARYVRQEGSKTAREAQQNQRQQQSSAEQAFTARKQQVRQLADYERDAARRGTRELEQEMRKRLEMERRNAQERRRAMLAAAFGVGTAVVGAMGRAQAVTGIESPEQIIARRRDARLGFIRQATSAGLSVDERNRVEARILQTSRETGVDPSQFYEALSTAQEKFSDLNGALDQLRDLGNIAMATGASLEDLTATGGELKRQFGLNDEQVRRSQYRIVAAAQSGSMGPREFANAFAEVMGQYASARGAAGRSEAGVSDFLGLAQVLASGGVGGEMAKTQASSMMQALLDPETQKRLRRHHVNVLDASHHVRSFQDIADQMVASRDFQDPNVMAQTFHEVRALRGFTTLVDRQRTGGAGSISALANAQEQAGRDLVSRTNANIRSDDVGRDIQAQVDRVTGVWAQGGEIADQLRTFASGLTDLQTKFPLATAALGEFVTGLQTTIAAMAGMNLAGVAGGAGGAGSLFTGSIASGGAGAVMGRLGWAGAALGAGLGVGSLIANAKVRDGSGDTVSQRMGTMFYRLFHRGEVEQEERSGFGRTRVRGLHGVGITADGRPVHLAPESARAIGQAVGAAVREGQSTEGRQTGRRGGSGSNLGGG